MRLLRYSFLTGFLGLVITMGLTLPYVHIAQDTGGISDVESTKEGSNSILEESCLVCSFIGTLAGISVVAEPPSNRVVVDQDHAERSLKKPSVHVVHADARAPPFC